MKRNFLAVLFMTVAVVASAQFNFGIKAGYNSTLALDNLNTITKGEYTFDNMKSEMSNSFQVGIFTRIHMNRFYLQPEFLYTVQKEGFDIMDVDANADGSNTMDVETFMNVSTVDIPIFLGYKIIDKRLLNLRAFIGPKIALNSGSQLEYSQLTNDFSLDQLAEDFKTSQVDLEAGIGVDVLRFALDAKLNLVRDLGGKIKSADNRVDATMPTSTFVISLGIRLF